MMTFEEWVKSRQDARQWTEDERACAEIAWNESHKATRQDELALIEMKNNRIADLEREMSWLQNHIFNLENMR